MKYFVGAALLFAVTAHSADSKCERVLIHSQSATKEFIAYVAELFAQGVVTDADLAALASLGAEAITNPIPEARGVISTVAAVHREALEQTIAENYLDAAAIQEWARTTLIEHGIIQKKREGVKVDTVDTYYKMQFHPVPAGEFMMGSPLTTAKVTLTHPFEAMSTPVTQKMWIDLMGENAAHYNDIRHRDHPVESVTWWSALEYANRLSIKMGFKPAYDLSHVKFRNGTKAEDGSLNGEEGDARINALDGNIYEAVGFRLPTEAESEYMLRGAGKTTTTYHFGDAEAELQNYGWYEANSEGRTHPVAELKPMVADGNRFYDLHGNVQEWIQNWNGGPQSGVDPQGYATGKRRMLKGGSWSRNAWDLRSAKSFDDYPSARSSSYGFRLVRTLK